tara:strand:- start:33 stop:242 length:210 start_codon:yes stop_codon:yes gene_type:complete
VFVSFFSAVFDLICGPGGVAVTDAQASHTMIWVEVVRRISLSEGYTILSIVVILSIIELVPQGSEEGPF